MSDPTSSTFDVRLDRVSKIAGILLPVVVALVGWLYTAKKDKNDQLARTAQDTRDQLARDAQAKRDDYQRNWDNTQKQYANLAALLPLLTSNDSSKIQMALVIYKAEADDHQAPVQLQATIQQISDSLPGQREAAQLALTAGKEQMASSCHWDPDGLYIQVENNQEQFKNGRLLVSTLKSTSSLVVHGAQRVDASPKRTQLRYFFTDANNAQAGLIKAELNKRGIKVSDDLDLSPKYLKKGCNIPGTFELWIGSSTPLNAEGNGTG